MARGWRPWVQIACREHLALVCVSMRAVGMFVDETAFLLKVRSSSRKKCGHTDARDDGTPLKRQTRSGLSTIGTAESDLKRRTKNLNPPSTPLLLHCFASTQHTVVLYYPSWSPRCDFFFSTAQSTSRNPTVVFTEMSLWWFKRLPISSVSSELASLRN